MITVMEAANEKHVIRATFISYNLNLHSYAVYGPDGQPRIASCSPGIYHVTATTTDLDVTSI